MTTTLKEPFRLDSRLQLVIPRKRNPRGRLLRCPLMWLTTLPAAPSESFGVASMPINNAFRLLLGISLAPAAPTRNISSIIESVSNDYFS